MVIAHEFVNEIDEVHSEQIGTGEFEVDEDDFWGVSGPENVSSVEVVVVQD